MKKRLNDVQYESRRALSQKKKKKKKIARIPLRPRSSWPGSRVDECQLFLAPVAVGGGIRALPDNIRLQPELVGERRFRSGVAFLHYRSSTADA